MTIIDSTQKKKSIEITLNNSTTDRNIRKLFELFSFISLVNMCAFCMVNILQHKIVPKLIFQVQTEKMASTEKMVSTFCITSE